MIQNFTIKRDDTKPKLRHLTDLPFSDLAGATVAARFRSAEGTVLAPAGTVAVLDVAGVAALDYAWGTDDTATTGQFYLEFEITFADGGIQTLPTEGFIVIKVAEDIPAPPSAPAITAAPGVAVTDAPTATTFLFTPPVVSGRPVPTVSRLLTLDGIDVTAAMTGNTYVAARTGAAQALVMTYTASNGIGAPTTAVLSRTVPALALVNTVAPAISGMAVEAQTLTISTGTWSGGPTAFACVLSNGAVPTGTGPWTYVVPNAAIGSTLTATVTASRAGTAAVAATSAATATVTAIPLVNTVAPSITGTAQEGQTLTASPGTWTGSPTGFAYQWNRNGVPILGATGSTRVIDAGAVGAVNTVTVTASKAGTASVSATSAATATITAIPLVNTAAPAITGIAQVGQTLTASPGTWTGSPTALAYQWLRGSTAISGATGSTYVPVFADVGTTLRAQVTASKAGTADVAVASPATAVVLPGPAPITAIDTYGWQGTWPSPPTTVAGNLVVTRSGFDAAGAPASFAETLQVTARVRQPGSATPSADQVALSDYVYAGETITGVTNNSALPYPYAHFAWAVPDDQEVKGNTVFLRIAVAHRHARAGRPVAAVRFIVTDHLGASASLLVTACVPVAYPVSGLSACVYEGTVDISALSTQGQPAVVTGTDIKNLTIDAEFRPWVGTAHRISAIAAAKNASGNRTLLFANNRNNWRPTLFSYVSTTGNDATAVVSTTAATAAAAPFRTITAAAVAMRNWHAANTGRGVQDGTVMRFFEGVHTWATWTNRVYDAYPATMEAADPTKAATTVILDAGVNTDNSAPSHLILRNLTLRKSSAANVRMIDSGSNTGGANGYLVCQNVIFDANGFAPNGNMIYRFPASYYEGCTQNADLAGGNRVVGCQGNFLSPGTTAAIACRVPNGQINPNTQDRVDGIFVGWNFITANRATYSQSLVCGFSTTELGIGIVGNILETFGTGGAGSSFLINGDGNTETSKNITIQGNTVIGGRANISYTDFGGAVRRDHLSTLRFNLLYEENHKAGDFFAYTGDTPNAARIGNWNVRYGVGSGYSTILQGESRASATPYYPMSWIGDVAPPGNVAGTEDVPLAVAFVNDQSATVSGGGTGGGSYQLTPGSVAVVARIPGSLTGYPNDLLGRAIPTSGAAVSGAIQMP